MATDQPFKEMFPSEDSNIRCAKCSALKNNAKVRMNVNDFNTFFNLYLLAGKSEQIFSFFIVLITGICREGSRRYPIGSTKFRLPDEHFFPIRFNRFVCSALGIKSVSTDH